MRAWERKEVSSDRKREERARGDSARRRARKREKESCSKERKIKDDRSRYQ